MSSFPDPFDPSIPFHPPNVDPDHFKPKPYGPPDHLDPHRIVFIQFKFERRIRI